MIIHFLLIRALPGSVTEGTAMQVGNARLGGSSVTAFAIATLAAVVGVLGGCASGPPPKEGPKLVWPAPPLPPRIEFVRSITSEDDLKTDTTFTASMVTFLAGEQMPDGRIASPAGLAVSGGRQRGEGTSRRCLGHRRHRGAGRGRGRRGPTGPAAEPDGKAGGHLESLPRVQRHLPPAGLRPKGEKGDRQQLITRPDRPRVPCGCSRLARRRERWMPRAPTRRRRPTGSHHPSTTPR